ncbi:MAG: hypothetical protein NWE95_11775 [Candidatus Bathyarchaeota archaeon]|nr:hypothetical protein [Candidatus Bathyarchaeota archaeon]
MDSVESYVFHQIFERVSLEVDLTGCTTANAINNRLKIARHQAKTMAKTAKTPFARKRWWFKAEELDKLLEHDFAGRAIFEARRNSRGIIALTLIYGRKTAREKIQAQKKAALRYRFDFTQVKRTPELRRGQVYRRWYK